jgi:serine/threonine-protein kinase
MWTPDGRRLMFSSQRAGVANLFWQAADGTGVAERLTESMNVQYPESISADGTQLVLEELATRSSDLQLLALGGERPSTLREPQGRPEPGRGTTGSGRGGPAAPSWAMPLIATMFIERNGQLSADGRWLAYESNESGRFEVYVRPFPGVDGGRWQVSTGGGMQPLFAPNSREIFFVDAEGRIVAVPIQNGPGFIAGNPQAIAGGARVTNPPGFFGRMYDVSRDGQRFLMVKAVEGTQQAAAPQQIIVVQNWFEELKRLAPAR